MADIDTEVKLVGDRDVVAALKELRIYMPKTTLRLAVRRAAQWLQQFVALVAPKATGNLASNILVKVRLTARSVRARVVVNTRGKADDPKNAFYWRFLEEGFHTRSGEFKKYPFVQGVFDAKNAEAAQMVIDDVEKAIQRAERRAKRFGG